MIKWWLIWCLNLVRTCHTYSRKTALSWLLIWIHGSASKWGRWDRIVRFLMDQQKLQPIRLIRFHAHHYRGSWYLPTKVIFRRLEYFESTSTTFVLLEPLYFIEVESRVVKRENFGLWRLLEGQFDWKIVYMLLFFHDSIKLLLSLGRWWLILTERLLIYHLLLVDKEVDWVIIWILWIIQPLTNFLLNFPLWYNLCALNLSQRVESSICIGLWSFLQAKVLVLQV